MCEEADSSQSCQSLDQGTYTTVLRVKGQQKWARGDTSMCQYTGIYNAFVKCTGLWITLTLFEYIHIGIWKAPGLLQTQTHGGY